MTSLKNLDGYRTSELLWRLDGWKLLNQRRFTCWEDGGRGDKNIEGSNRSKTSVTVPILWTQSAMQISSHLNPSNTIKYRSYDSRTT